MKNNKEIKIREIKRHWQRYLPNIDIYISIPFLTIRTSLLLERFDSLEIEWTYLYVKLFKWKFDFRIYSRKLDFIT